MIELPAKANPLRGRGKSRLPPIERMEQTKCLSAENCDVRFDAKLTIPVEPRNLGIDHGSTRLVVRSKLRTSQVEDFEKTTPKEALQVVLGKDGPQRMLVVITARAACFAGMRGTDAGGRGGGSAGLAGAVLRVALALPVAGTFPFRAGGRGCRKVPPLRCARVRDDIPLNGGAFEYSGIVSSYPSSLVYCNHRGGGGILEFCNRTARGTVS